jgi:hypothetical protein
MREESFVPGAERKHGRAIERPMAKPRLIDHTVDDTTSILKTIEVRWNPQRWGRGTPPRTTSATRFDNP